MLGTSPWIVRRCRHMPAQTYAVALCFTALHRRLWAYQNSLTSRAHNMFQGAGVVFRQKQTAVLGRKVKCIHLWTSEWLHATAVYIRRWTGLFYSATVRLAECQQSGPSWYYAKSSISASLSAYSISIVQQVCRKALPIKCQQAAHALCPALLQYNSLAPTADTEPKPGLPLFEWQALLLHLRVPAPGLL